MSVFHLDLSCEFDFKKLIVVLSNEITGRSGNFRFQKQSKPIEYNTFDPLLNHFDRPQKRTNWREKHVYHMRSAVEEAIADEERSRATRLKIQTAKRSEQHDSL